MCWTCSTHWDEKHIIGLNFRIEHLGDLVIIGTVAVKYDIKTCEVIQAGPARAG
jgi:hypothetical protein